jgi:hypothetical protein
MTVSGNLVTALDGLANRLGIELGAGCIGADRARRLEAIENANAAPYSIQTTSLKPGVIDHSGIAWGQYGGNEGLWRPSDQVSKSTVIITAMRLPCGHSKLLLGMAMPS